MNIEEKIDDLIKPLMARYMGWHGSATWVDAPYEACDYDSNGRVTGPGQWRALRRFAKEVLALKEEQQEGIKL